VTGTLAFECYADEDVARFLGEHCHLPLRRLHRYGQGQVVDAVLIRGVAAIGLVDEDPGKPHHGQRDRTTVVSETVDLIHRRKGDRHLFVVRPDLEECFLACTRRLGIVPRDLPQDARELRTLLGLHRHRTHEAFRRELASLHRESRSRAIATFVTDLETGLRAVL